MTDQRYVHPRAGRCGALIERIANCATLARVRRTLTRSLPFPVLVSDVVDVVYATWLVDAERAQRFVPERAMLWVRDKRTPLTVLTYRHGHFGPEFAGPLRRLFPSPLQSNWRLYLEQPLPRAPNVPTVVFVTNVIDNGLYALGTRVFSDSLPSHLSARLRLEIAERSIAVEIHPGAGSAPRLAMTLARNDSPLLPTSFDAFGTTWAGLVARLALQDAAVVPRDDLSAVALGTIRLPIDLDSVEPLALASSTLECPLLDELGGTPDAVCFRVPKVRFEVLSDRLL